MAAATAGVRSVERASQMRQWVGKRVQVTLRGGDVSERPPVVLVGTVYALALRERGGADWGGAQYDMVLDADRAVRTFALSRIEGIKPA